MGPRLWRGLGCIDFTVLVGVGKMRWVELGRMG